jgi:hypothetical protein
MKIKRFDCNPIIHLGLSETLDGNINGPSLIEAPDWLPDRLGKYYLYFAHHIGSFIRLAYSDRLEGPWSIYEPGTLHIEQSHCYNHVASPDIHVDDVRREIRMYYHGWVGDRVQRTKVAVSRDGLHFEASSESLGQPYFRVFQWQGYHYAVGMPGVFYRSKDGLTGFKQGPTLFKDNMRHTALAIEGDTLKVFYTNAADSPERIFLSTIDIGGDWSHCGKPRTPSWRWNRRWSTRARTCNPHLQPAGQCWKGCASSGTRASTGKTARPTSCTP